jgi:gamma-tubulin complex component 3
MIRRWVLEGELDDIYKEFFISGDPSVGDEGLWRDCYKVRQAMLPSFIPPELAHRILRSVELNTLS